MTDEKRAVKTIAEAMVKAMRSSRGGSSQPSVTNTSVDSITASKVIGLPSAVYTLISGVEDESVTDAAALQALTALQGIASGEFETITADTAKIDKVYATFGTFMNLVSQEAHIGDLDVGAIKASLADIGMTNIGSAVIDMAQIRRSSTQTAFIHEGVAGEIYIDDLSVNEASIVNLAAGKILLNDSSGDLVELYVDEQDGTIKTRTVAYDGSDIINSNSLNGDRIIQNSITASKLNANEIFAANATVMNLIGDNIDASRIRTGTLDAGLISTLNSSTTVGGKSLNTIINNVDGSIKDQHRVYISKASGTQSVQKPVSWINNTSDTQNTWTVTRPTYNIGYPVLFTAVQTKFVDGTVTCTDPIKDNTTTVIDGGHITTGTIDAGVVAVTNINANNINTGHLNANYIQGGTLTLGGTDNQNGTLLIKNDEDSSIGSWDRYGISAKSFDFDGDLSSKIVISNAYTGKTNTYNYNGLYLHHPDNYGYYDISLKMQGVDSSNPNPYGLVVKRVYETGSAADYTNQVLINENIKVSLGNYLGHSYDTILSPYALRFDKDNTQISYYGEDAFVGGDLTANGDIVMTSSGSIIHPPAAVSYTGGANGHSAALFARKTYNIDSWYPAVALETMGGGAWQIGNHNDENIEFVYATKENRDRDTNIVTSIYMCNGDTGRVLTSDNYTQWAPTKTGSGASGTWGISISGNAATATKATQDGSGNSITSTYLKLSGGTITGDLTVNGDITMTANGSYIHPAAAVSYTGGANGQSAALFAKKAYNIDSWYPAVALETMGGGAWQIGNHNNENIEFVYATKENRDDDTNIVTSIYMHNGDTGRVLTSDNYAQIIPSPPAIRLFKDYLTSNYSSSGNKKEAFAQLGTVSIEAGNYFVVGCCVAHQSGGAGIVSLDFQGYPNIGSPSYSVFSVVSDGAHGMSGSQIVVFGIINFASSGNYSVDFSINAQSAETLTVYSHSTYAAFLIPVN